MCMRAAASFDPGPGKVSGGRRASCPQQLRDCKAAESNFGC